jgi:Family of unknown function (DUF5675)
MADEEMYGPDFPTIYLFRSSEYFSNENAEGSRGYIVIGEIAYFSLERSGGYVTLPKGKFECVMEQHKSKGRVFRVTATGEHGHNVPRQAGGYAGILIHSANKPSHLLGCVAPGRKKETFGVSESKKAMEDIFTYCGGFGAGKKAWLEVDNMPAS